MPMQLSLEVLGVSGGASPVYQGECSSSLLLLHNDQPYCLIDLGPGVTRTLHESNRAIPDQLIITHNHTDHAGELPVVLRVEQARGRHLRVIAETEVKARLQQHRLAEHAEQLTPEKLADWTSADAGERIALDEILSLRFIAAQHSERCFGFIIYSIDENGNDIPVLGYSGDSGLNPSLYQQISQAAVTIYDAREKGNAWHAGFDEIEPWLSRNDWIIGHGVHKTDSFNDLPLLRPGQIISLKESE